MNSDNYLPKVSVVVPVYNVENYIKQCIQSIVHQTYRELEIILIDDGSADNSGKYCDQESQKDNRIKVFHKENGGLSSARNKGTENACGEFIVYLDGDDYLEQNAIEKLMQAQEEFGADVVVGNYAYTYDDHEDLADAFKFDLKPLNAREAVGLLTEGKIQTFAWGKLIKTDIAKMVHFPEGKLFEDHFWTHLIFHKSHCIVCIENVVVHYRQRNTSISYTYNLSHLDIVEGWKSRIRFLENEYPNLVDKYKERCAEDCCLQAWLITVKMKNSKKQGFKIIQNFIKDFGLENYCSGRNQKLICALKRNYMLYMLLAVFYKIV